MSNTYQTAEKFFQDNKKSLYKIILKSSNFQIVDQPEYCQVGIFFDDFSITYQDSDMNGNGKGQLHWDNDGADQIYDELQQFMRKDSRFDDIFADDEFHENEITNEFIDYFCGRFAEENNIEL